jgi:predicted alternative tryptophan synthase beta-subunit
MITSGEYVYDLQNTLSAATPVVKTYLYGKFTVVEDVTNS